MTADIRNLGVPAFFAVLVKDGETEIVTEHPNILTMSHSNNLGQMVCLSMLDGKGRTYYAPNRKLRRQGFMGYLEASVRDGWIVGWLGPRPGSLN